MERSSSKIYQTCLNLITGNDFMKANELFIKSYYEHPEGIELLLGAVISFILLGKNYNCSVFLKKETEVSPFHAEVILLLNFLELNKYFSGFKPQSAIFNIGLFLYKNKFYDEAVLLFDACLTLEPGHAKCLILKSEYEILKNQNLANGIMYLTMASATLGKTG